MIPVDSSLAWRVPKISTLRYRASCLNLNSAPGAMRRSGADTAFSEKIASAPDLRIAPGAEFKFKQEARYRNVEIFGTLHAKLESTGIITVRPGGLLSGEVRAQHLVVEDGGGLTAMLRIAPKSEVVPEGEQAA